MTHQLSLVLESLDDWIGTTVQLQKTYTVTRILATWTVSNDISKTKLQSHLRISGGWQETLDSRFLVFDVRQVK